MSAKLLRNAAFAPSRRLPISSRFANQRRYVQTLQDNPHVHIFGDGERKILTYAESAREDIAIGTSPVVPPSPDTFIENPKFKSILQSVMKEHAHKDPHMVAEAQAFASNASSTLISGGAFAQQRGAGASHGAGGSGTGVTASSAHGGYVHVWDLRNPPDFGRIPDPEDIFGSLEVDSEGSFVDGNGSYQDSGTHRMVSFNGLLKLTPFIREKLVERLKQESSS